MNAVGFATSLICAALHDPHSESAADVPDYCVLLMHCEDARLKRPFILALLLTLSATGAWADRYSDCSQTKDTDRRIRACTQIIERGKQESRKDRAFAYHYRGLAYNEQAIADFRKSFEINPSDQDMKNKLKRLGVTTISAASMETDKRVPKPNDKLRNVGCKKFIPAIGMSVTVPCK